MFGKKEEVVVFHKFMYGILDRQVGFYPEFVFSRNRESALRIWKNLCNNPESAPFKHPEHFYLVELAGVNEITGQVVPHAAPDVIGHALSYKDTNIVSNVGGASVSALGSEAVQ